MIPPPVHRWLDYRLDRCITMKITIYKHFGQEKHRQTSPFCGGEGSFDNLCLIKTIFFMIVWLSETNLCIWSPPRSWRRAVPQSPPSSCCCCWPTGGRHWELREGLRRQTDGRMEKQVSGAPAMWAAELTLRIKDDSRPILWWQLSVFQ